MKPVIITLLLAAALPTLAADGPKPDLLKLAELHTNSLVTVEYELQFDDADAPQGGLGAAALPRRRQRRPHP